MKELIVKALESAISILESKIPLTKRDVESISIVDVTPIDLIKTMKEYDVPDSAWFDSRDNENDGYSDILLSWYIEVPTTEKDKSEFRVKKFRNVAWQLVYAILTQNGYSRIPCNTAKLKAFDDTTLYDMRIIKDYDRITAYYSLFFDKRNA